jgi:hypothetical protein
VFQLELYYKNWLALGKCKAALGVPCKRSGFITKADIEIEIQNQLLEEFTSLDSNVEVREVQASREEEGLGEDSEDNGDNEDPPADFQGDLQVPICHDDEQPTLPFAEAEDEVLQSVCDGSSHARSYRCLRQGAVPRGSSQGLRPGQTGSLCI